MLFLLPQFFPGPSISQLYILFLPLFRIKMKNPYTIWVISILSYLIGFYSFLCFPAGSGLVSSRLNLPVACVCLLSKGPRKERG